MLTFIRESLEKSDQLTRGMVSSRNGGEFHAASLCDVIFSRLLTFTTYTGPARYASLVLLMLGYYGVYFIKYTYMVKKHAWLAFSISLRNG